MRAHSYALFLCWETVRESLTGECDDDSQSTAPAECAYCSPPRRATPGQGRLFSTLASPHHLIGVLRARQLRQGVWNRVPLGDGGRGGAGWASLLNGVGTGPRRARSLATSSKTAYLVACLQHACSLLDLSLWCQRPARRGAGWGGAGHRAGLVRAAQGAGPAGPAIRGSPSLGSRWSSQGCYLIQHAVWPSSMGWRRACRARPCPGTPYRTVPPCLVRCTPGRRLLADR